MFSTEQCARWVSGAPLISDAATLDSAARSFLDTIAAIAAGFDSEAAERCFQAVRPFGGSGATVAGRPETLAPVWAAMVNGVAAHAAELDDNFLAAGVHGSAVLVPALLALGEALDSRGHAVLDAYVVGLQVQWRLSQALNPRHGELGWHPTSTLGTVGVAAACSRLLRLPQPQVEAALGLSASLMGGSDAQFGAMAKPWHAGLAAHHGLMSAYLAQAGMSAGRGALEGPRGTIVLMGGLPGPGDAPEAFGEPLALITFGMAMKLWPTCGSTHPPIDAALKALGSRNVADIAAVRITLPEVLDANLKFREPGDADQAKFSLEFSVAAALLDGDVTLESLNAASRARAALLALSRKISRTTVANDYADLAAEVEIRFDDGGRVLARSGFADLRGTRDHPLSRVDLVGKLMSCARGRATPAVAEAIAAATLAMSRDAPVSGVLAHLGFSPASAPTKAAIVTDL